MDYEETEDPTASACPQFLALPKSNICMRCKQEYAQHQPGLFANQLQARQQEVTGWVHITLVTLTHLHNATQQQIY